ncbi:hypothetical protein FUAX_54080 (plasmid) [Fulvitalea axinellae]|uniref:AAA domain-containing protein n=1 Tax=Fulvitalea axinellae TaxID=1182444 RepID=A0AAU9CV94_9BACT|nr:hypothetical protein FUAX_54080 [Fulvitalea axinellae]
MPKIISIINHKGGVGKTTVTANLGAALAKQGFSVLLADFDPQANLTAHLDAVPEDGQPTIADAIIRNGETPVAPITENLSIIPGNLELARAESEYAGRMNAFLLLREKLEQLQSFDYILIDCPPSLGFFTLNALNASTHVLVPCEASKMASDGLLTLTELIGEVQRYGNKELNLLGVLISNKAVRTYQNEFEAMMRQHYPVLDTVIRSYKHLGECASMQQSIFDYAPQSNSADDFTSLATEVNQLTQHEKEIR